MPRRAGVYCRTGNQNRDYIREVRRNGKGPGWGALLRRATNGVGAGGIRGLGDGNRARGSRHYARATGRAGPRRRLRNGDTDSVLLCNHSTGECATRHDGYRAAHRVSKFLPWLVTTGLGTVGYVMGIATVYRALASTGIRPSGSLSDRWIVGFVVSAIIAVIFVGITAAVIRGLRNRKVERQYIPAFIQFLAQSTPTLAQRFAAP